MAKKQQTRKAAPSKKVAKAFKKAAAKTQPKATKEKQPKASPKKQTNSSTSAAVKRDAPATPLSEICADPRNPRRRAITLETDSGLHDLAESIAKFGDVLEPLIVRQRTKAELKEDGFIDGPPYMLISGHRRMAAAKLAGIDRLHCIVWENISPAEAFEMQLVENLHRADLLPTEEASAYQRMSEELGYTHREISLRVGRSEKHILRYLKFCNLPEDFKAELDSGEISIQKALFFCSLPDKTAEGIMKCGRHWLAHDFTFGEFKENVLKSFLADLEGSHIQFKLDGKYGNLPKCTECPHKGTQPELFAEYASESKCPFAECFREKTRLAQAQKAKAQAKNKPAKQEAEEDEEQESTSSGVDWQKEFAIRQAVRMAAARWYSDKLMERGIKPTDVFFDNFGGHFFLDKEPEELYVQYCGKNCDELKDAGTYEEILKALIINYLYNEVDKNGDDLAEWLGCGECPDDVLQKARAEAMGIKK